MRFSYPFELEWMEGGSLLQAIRLAHGQTLYGPPHLAFTPFIYPPLYFALGSLLDLVGMLSLPGLRMLSLISMVWVFFVLARWTWLESQNRISSLVAMGVFAASFPQSGFFFDLARVDSLWVALIASAAYQLRFAKNQKALFFAALLMGLSVFTKQQSIVLGLLMLLSTFIHNRKAGLFYGFTWLGFLTIGFIYLQIQSHGWFSYYTFYLPSHHHLIYYQILGFWLTDFGFRQLLPIFAGLTLAITSYRQNGIFFSLVKSNRGLSRFFYPCLLSGLIIMAWSSRLHSGGYLNVLLPAYFALALASGIVWKKITELTLPYYKEWVLVLLIGFTWVSWLYNPKTQIPTKADQKAGEQIVQQITKENGEVWILNHPYLALFSAKEPMAHRMALEDVLRVPDSVSADVKREIRDAIFQKRFNSIYLNTTSVEEEAILPLGFNLHYSFKDSMFQAERIFRPKTGVKLRPQYRFGFP